MGGHTRTGSHPQEKPTSERLKDVAKAGADLAREEAAGRHETQFGARERISYSDAEGIIRDWPEAPRRAAEQMLERYGAPNEATATKLYWYNVGPWKRLFATRDMIAHHFPQPHGDFLSSTIGYKVPLDAVAAVTAFDGSCIIDRTAGEVTARCDSEWANILTLNMMHEIVQGTKSVEDARKAFADAASAYVLGRPSPHAERLQFALPTEPTHDTDTSNIGPAMGKNLLGKAKDVAFGER